MSLIKKIRIYNFKSLEEVEIEMNQLTFLFGPNSSGKSSFIKALMFLSKNLFPLNRGKTIYKISEDVDLGSYKDIATNGDRNSSIVFEIDLQGEFEFPKKDVFEDGKYSNDPILNSYLPSEIKEKNFFRVFEEIISCIKEKQILDKSFLEKNDFDVTYRISFREPYKNSVYNLDEFSIKDNIKKSTYEVYKNIDLSEENIAGEEKFNFLQNKEVSNLFNEYLGSVMTIDDVYETVPEDEELPFTYFNLSKIEPFLNGNFNKVGPFREKYFSQGWEKFNQREKINFYFEVLKFCYLVNKIAPKLFANFLRYRHLPTTRKIPEKRYWIDKNEFGENEYYGLLNILFNSQSPPQCNDNFSENFQLIQYFKKTEKFNDLFLNIFYSLVKLGFKLFYKIQINGEVGKIYLIDENNKRFNFKDASSGLIQVFPIIVFCNVLLGVSLENIEESKPIPFLDDSYFYFSYYEGFFSSVLIEQPELHLHPKLQSQLAQLFADTVNEANASSSLIIETHSEHLIRKIQVLIAKGELDREKVGVWYFDNSEGMTKIKEMKIEPNGFFKEPWPNGFFDDSANLSWELLTANKN